MTAKRIGLVLECGEAFFEHMLCTGADEKVFPLPCFERIMMILEWN